MLTTDLPQPPPVVENAIHHWLEYLRFLPKAGPPAQTMCAGIEREYHHITRKLQAQYHEQEPDEKQMYDYWLGKRMEEELIRSLPDTKKGVLKSLHYSHHTVPMILREYKLSERSLLAEIRGAYLMLGAKLCQKENAK